MKRLLPIICASMLFVSCHNTDSEDAKMNSFIDNLMSKMTLKEKVGQLNLVSNWNYVSNSTTSEMSVAMRQIKDGDMGGVYGFNDLKIMKEIQQFAVDSTRLHIPLIFGNDVIHGLITTYPIPLAISTSWNMDLVEKSARMAAREATSVGLNWVFSPMVDICRDARWGRICEGGGEDPYLGGQIARAYVKGYQGDDLSADTTVMVCVKHYALYGAAESGRDYNSVFLSRQEAFNGYLNPYKQAALAGAGSYMSSFNEFEGIPSTCNKFLLTDVLRGMWGFNGFVVSDATAVNEIINHGIGDQAEASRRALEAGLDMDMGSNAYVSNLVAMVKEGKVKESNVDRACRNILVAKYRLGLFDDPYRYLVDGRDEKECYTKEQHDFARTIAQECQVLLKNDKIQDSFAAKASSLGWPSDKILPLSKNAKIAVVGPFADNASEMCGSWSATKSELYNDAVTILTGIKEKAAEGCVSYAEGSWIMKDEKIEDGVRYSFGRLVNPDGVFEKIHTVPLETMIADAVAKARQSDVVVACVGELNLMNGEGASRSDISVPDAQEELLKALKATGKPLVVVLTTGRPLILNWEAENADAILNTWSLGAEAGHAIADVLFGDVNPSAKLTTSFPRSVGQLPIYYNHKNTGRPWPEDKEYQKFSSCYTDVLNSPLYPFGYGLSYTTYEYGDVVLSSNNLSGDGSVEASVKVKNTGKRDGKEIVQLYIHDVYSSSTRPVKELKAFDKVLIKSGEEKIVKFTISKDDLKYYNHDLDYVCEPGDYEIMIGPDSKNVKKAFLSVE